MMLKNMSDHMVRLRLVILGKSNEFQVRYVSLLQQDQEMT